MRFDSRITAFLLKQQHVGETDVLVTWYTQELGKVRSIVLGARKPQSKLVFALQPGAFVSMRLVGRNVEQGLLRLAGVYSVELMVRNCSEAQALLLSWFLEVIIRATPDAEKNERLFSTARRFFLALNGAVAIVDVLLIGVTTLIQLLEALGVAVHEDRITPRYFSVRGGGFFHEHPGHPDAKPVSEDLWHAYETARDGVSLVGSDAVVQEQLFIFLESHLEYYLEREIRSFAFLDGIIKMELQKND